LNWYDGEGENGITSKRIFEFEETLGAFIFLPLFFLFLSPFFAPPLEDLGILLIFEEEITSSKTSYQMASI
jgi:hypothetical protein